MQNLAYYFSTSYLFDKLPEQEPTLLIGMVIFFACLIIIGIITSIILGPKIKKIPPYKILKNHISNCTLTIGIIGMFLVFFRWQEVLYFSAPILILILLLAFLVWIIYIITYIRIKLIDDLKQFQVEKRYQLYLPHKKSKTY